MNNSKYNFYSRAYLIDITIVSIVLITIAQEAILNGAYISAVIIILSTIFLLGKINYLMDDVPKEDIFHVYKSHFFPIKVFGNYIQCISLIPLETVRKANNENILGSIPLLSISKTKFKAGDMIQCRFIDAYNKGSFIQFCNGFDKEEEDS